MDKRKLENNQNEEEEEEEEHLALIVEDEAMIRKFIISNLEKKKQFVTREAESVDEALFEIDAAAERYQFFEVIFLDLYLKDEKTGIDFLKIRKERKLEEQGIVVVMSGNEDAKLVEECHNYNIQNYVKKPVSKHNLENEIIKVNNYIKTLKCPFKGFRKERKIGQGGTGEVFLVRDKKTKEPFAMKKVMCDSGSTIDMETSYMMGLAAPTVLQLKKRLVVDNYVYMLIEFAQNGTLTDWIKKIKEESTYTVNADQILLWMTEALLGLYNIHEKSLIHRDIKTDNLFLCQNDVCKIGDLGIAKAIKAGAMTVCGTHHYMAPEIHKKELYDAKVDIWALGIVLYELVMLKKPFDGSSDEIIDKVTRMDFIPFPKSTDSRLIKLLKLMLQPDRNLRASSKELLQQIYIKEKLQQIIDSKIIEIDEEVLYKILKEDNNSNEYNSSSKKPELKELKENIKKHTQFSEQFSQAITLDTNSTNKITYQKSYFSTKYENVLSGTDLMMCATDFKITEATLNTLIASGFLVNVCDPNETEFQDEDKVYYQIRLLDDPKIDNLTFYPSWFNPSSKQPVRLTQECLELAITLFQKLEEEEGENVKDSILASKDYSDFMVEIKHIKHIQFNSLKKNEKLATILNIYQTMMIHHYINIELGIEGTVGSSGLLSKVKGLVATNSTNRKQIIYNIGGHNMSLYDLKHITIRRNKKPLDAYMRLASDGDARIALIDEKENNKFLFICQDPTGDSISDIGVNFHFQKFSDEVDTELDNYVKEFVSQNVDFDDTDIMIPRFLKQYLVDFSGSEQDLVKFLYKHHNEPNGKISSIVKAINNKTANINYT